MTDKEKLMALLQSQGLGFCLGGDACNELSLSVAEFYLALKFDKDDRFKSATIERRA